MIGLSANMRNSFSGRDTSCDDEKQTASGLVGVAQRAAMREEKRIRPKSLQAENDWRTNRGANESEGASKEAGVVLDPNGQSSMRSRPMSGSIPVREIPSWVSVGCV
jgi:hypothetical protein